MSRKKHPIDIESVANKYCLSPTQENRNNLIEACDPLIWKVIRNDFVIQENLYGDAYNEAVLGIINSLEKYDPKKGKFSTFVYDYIKLYVRKLIAANISPLELNHGTFGRARQIKNYLDSGEPKGKKPSNRQLRRYSYIINTPVQIENVENLKYRQAIEELKFDRSFLNVLTEEEKSIVEYRYLSGELKTIDETAKKVGLRRQWCFVLCEKALEKLKFAMNKKNIKSISDI